MTFFAHSLAKSRKTLALVALFCAALAPCAWADFSKTNPVTGETETYANGFTGVTAEWNSADNWDTGTTPFISDNYNPSLVDGKTASTATEIDGYMLRVGAYNGASITWAGGIKKIQAGSVGCWLTADETSSITIASFAGNQIENNGNNVVFKLTSANPGGITWSTGLSSVSGYQNLEFQYYLGGDGTVVYGGGLTVNNPQVIKQADVLLSDGAKSVKRKTLVSFTSTTKTFTADASVKLKNSLGVQVSRCHVGAVRQSGAAIEDTASTLTTSDAVGSCEIVQATDGIVLYYVDGPVGEVATYKPSINVNFTTGGAYGLTTQEDVGLAGYVAPGASWNNFTIPNNSNTQTLGVVNALDSTGESSPAAGVSVEVSGHRGSYSCGALGAAAELRHGYIDDGLAYATPTITVTGIPYDHYRVVVYHSTDSQNYPFGYDAINDVDYMYVDGVRKVGAHSWGDAGADKGALPIEEGVNTVVSGVISNNAQKTLKIVAHRMSGSPVPRGCVAAFQIVKVDTGGKDYWALEPSVPSGWLAGDGPVGLDPGVLGGGSPVRVYRAVDTATSESVEFGEPGGFMALPAGNYKVTVYNADKSVASDEFAVAVAANAVGAKYDDHVTFYVNGSGTDAIENFPLLVRIGEAQIPGFAYGRADKDRLAFVDGQGNALNYDVDTWDEGGESSVWVLVPSVPAGGTQVTMYWALKGAETAPENDPTKVWADYTGVWHMGDAKDSSASGFLGATNGSSSVAKGLAGGALSQNSKRGPLVTVPVDERINSWTNAGFTVSMWFKPNDGDTYKAFLFGRRAIGGATGVTTVNNGYGVQINESSINAVSGGKTGMVMYNGASGSGQYYSANVSGLQIGKWARLDFLYTPNRYEWWVDGVLQTYAASAEHNLFNPVDVGIGFAIGGAPGTVENSVNGAIDEFRICTNAVSEAKVAAECANAGQLSLSSATAEAGSFLVPGMAVTNGSVFVDYWVEGASLTKDFWIYGESGDVEILPGVIRSGDIRRSYVAVNLDTGDETPVAGSADMSALVPGRYRLVASSDALSEVSTFDFTVQAVPADVFADHVTLTLNDVGDTPVENYTLLVRASETQLPGFKYSRAGDGSRIAFTGEDGVALPYDVDTWDPVGESLIWVKVPSAVNGTKVTFWWAYNGVYAAPANDPTKVWTDYAGVWHMNDARDASGNSARGTLHADAVRRSDGMLGTAYGRTVTGAHGPIASIPASDAMDSLAGGVFTVSGWMRLNSLETHWANIFSRSERDSTDAWRVRFSGGGGYGTADSVQVHANGTSSKTFTTTGKFTAGEWGLVSAVYKSNSVELFVNGAILGTQTGTTAAKNAGFGFYIGGMAYDDPSSTGHPSGTTSTLDGDMDEVRLYKGAAAATLIVAEYKNANFTDYLGAEAGEGGGFLVPSVVTVDGEEVDYWMEEPSISPTVWETGAAPTVAISSGRLRSGASVAKHGVNVATGEDIGEVTEATLAALPIGTYRITFEPESTAPARMFYITVTEKSGVDIVGGTASGRILLMNNDYTHGGTASAPQISYQGWANNKSTTVTFWERCNTISGAVNIMASTESILWTQDFGYKLWHLVECRHGNTFPSSGSGTTGLKSEQNYLPYSSKSLNIKNTLTTAVPRSGVGQLLMRDTKDSAVYSPCYTNGIGTIYFDAVNGWNDNINTYNDPMLGEGQNAYQIVVEMATKTKDGLEPTDENSVTYTPNVSGEDDDGNPIYDGTVTTNWYGNLPDECWDRCDLNPIMVNGERLTSLDQTKTLALSVTGGGSMTNFYRVYISLDIANPVRFRIRRVSVDPNYATHSDSTAKAFILLDNIIVSEPKSSAELKPAGWYDVNKRGRDVLGQECAFSAPFPVMGGNVYAKAVPEYTIASAVPPEETNFIASAVMHWRWRYLDQAVGEWQSSVLDPKDDFRSAAPISLPNEPGDVEFWYETALQIPYYSYTDYSGQSLEDEFAAIYSEGSTIATNRANAAFGYYPTRGTDWFVRLREAASSNEVWRLYVTNADGSAYDVDGNGATFADFELMEGGTWRAFVKTPSALESGLRYRIEQINPQPADADEFVFSTNCWRGVDALVDTVRSTRLAGDASGSRWSGVYCPGTTGHLMFLLDEGSGEPTLSVVCADYQDFNGWNDANRNSITFVATSAETGDKVGVSPKMKVYEEIFGNWNPCAATNVYWTESFDEDIDDPGYPGYTPFDSAGTPNGWQAGPGMWVHEKYRNVGMAYEMLGRGQGQLLFQNTAVSPRGIEDIIFKTRLAQSVSLADLYLSDVAPWNGSIKTMTNYTFVVQAAMSDVNTTSVSTWESLFDGPGQISVFGGFRAGRGGYELRVMRTQEKRYEAALYRWVGSTATKLTSCSGAHNYGSLPFTLYKNLYPTLYMSVDYQTDDGSCKVHAGFSFGNQSDTSTSEGRTGHAALGSLPGSGRIVKLCYWDAEPPSKGWGSFGIASANCPAVFGSPRVYDSATPFPTWAASGTYMVKKGEAANWGYHSSKTAQDFTASTAFGFKGTPWDLRDKVADDWTVENDDYTIDDDTNKRIHAKAPAQSLLVQWAPDGSQDWQTLTNMTVSSFLLSDAVTIPVHSKVNAAIRLKHGGKTVDGQCVDIALDDVVVRQWRGDDYDSNGQDAFRDVSYGSPTNFVFTSAWVHDNGSKGSGANLRYLRSAELSAKRTATNGVSSIRSPLFDGLAGRSVGLGMFAFSYTNADHRAKLLLQVATNDNVGVTTLASYTKYLPDDSRWTTVANFDFSALSDEEREGGVMTHYLGLHGQKGVMRLVVDPATVEASETSDDPAYGQVFITEVVCRDEPILDTSCWWGWNLRTGTGLYAVEDLDLAQLGDYPDSGNAKVGMSAALNNSVENDIDERDYQTYREHQPFIQTPTFTNGTEVGQFTVRARRYDQFSSINARVSVYGANMTGAGKVDVNEDANWTYVTHFDVTNDTYRTYTFKTKGNQSFQALRFVVVGMPTVAQKHGKPATDPAYRNLGAVVRVALDDLVVTEALRPKLALRNVFAFRSDPNTLGPETDLLSRSAIDGYGKMEMQPLAGESWGVQAEVYASQLPDEIDFDQGLEVTLYWYDDKNGGCLPWGYSNWEENSAAKKAALAPCDDNPLVFRSTFADGYVDSVLPERAAGTVAQYMLKVDYHTFDSPEPLTVWLTKDDWTKPAWYRGIDYNNKEFAAAKSFAAYCIFDDVAPGWAWINEVNAFGGLGAGDSNLDETRQYIEVAMPAEADLTDWRLDFISKDGVTNTVCRFGTDAAAKKSVNAASNCVFLVVSSPDSKAALEEMTVDGNPVVVDGTWHFDKWDGWTFDPEGTLGYWFPVAAQLVRPSGIIEHRIAFEGTNMYAEISEELGREYSASNLVERLNAADPDGGWTLAGDDSIAGDRSLGETGRSADTTSYWLNTQKRTPGFINQLQAIDPMHPTANGTSYLIYASIDPASGHITQTFGDEVDTRELVTVVAQKGTSKDIVYNLENWYELAAVNVNGKDIDLPEDRTGHVTVALGGPSTSNNLTVVASSRVNSTLADEWGLTPENRYTPAVVDWLNRGTTLRGPFAHPEGPLYAARFVPLSQRGDPDAGRPMDLTQMYWLDIDPTESNWCFVAGMVRPPSPVVVTPEYEADHNAENNVEMGVYMCITNTGVGRGDRFAPYVLRGVAPGETSWAYSAGEFSSWTGATFKITGKLANGLQYNVGWVPLRWFVFDSGSFTPAGAEDEFQSSIEVLDPYSTESPGFAHGWSKWRGRANVFYSWTIEDGRSVFNAWTLRPTNWISQ